MRCAACVAALVGVVSPSVVAGTVDLTGPWWFRTDPGNAGREQGFATASPTDEGWEATQIGQYWEGAGHPDYDGYAWYRTDVEVPVDWGGDDIFILVGGVDDAYELFVNGKSAGSHGDMVHDSQTVNRILTHLRVGPLLEPGQRNTFAFRVHDFGGAGGIVPGDVKLVDDARLLPVMARYELAAESAPDGYYPRWIEGRQVYWTITGAENSLHETAFGEEGTIEPKSKSFSLAPFLYVDGKLITSADVRLEQTLEDGYLPIPTVAWITDRFELSQTVFTWGDGADCTTYVTYRLANKSSAPVRGRLFLAIRPFQLVPPTMYGGLADIRDVVSLGPDRAQVLVNGEQLLVALRRPDKFGAQSFDDGDVVQTLAEGRVPGPDNVHDDSGRASAAWAYGFDLAPGAADMYTFVLPLEPRKGTIKPPGPHEVTHLHEQVRSHWRKRLNQVRFDVPDRRLLDTYRSNLAYILISRDGLALQPGSRNYEKAWIRDGAEIAAALMRAGCAEEAGQFVSWFARQQLPSGEMPCIVLADGTRPGFSLDWREYDGQGAFVFACAEHYRFTRDREFVANHYDQVVKALQFLARLREDSLGDPEPAHRGILPASNSHEGYFPAMHSYWDDFWALKGWQDGQLLASIAGTEEQAEWMAEQERLLRDGLLRSIASVQKRGNASYIPGCAEKCDFDATSTAISVWPTEQAKHLPADALAATFDKYYRDTLLPRVRDFVHGRFTPYEVRTALAWLIRGETEKTETLLSHLMDMRRPAGWNHWAEVVTGDPHVPHYLGDMPHMWIGAEFVVLFRSLLLYEAGDTLVLGRGIRRDWLRGDAPIGVTDAPTHFGRITYTLTRREDGVVFQAAGDARPPGGFQLSLPGVEERFDALPFEKVFPLSR